MIEDRKHKELEDDRGKWKIYFDLEMDKMKEKGDKTVIVSFVINRKEYPLTENDLEKLKQDLKDLGKFRIVRGGKSF
jgi:hypothetical protein